MIAIDTEALLRWAYRDELPKQEAAAFSPWERFLEVGQLGTRIDESHMARLPAVLGAPHPDAIVIAKAVARLPHRSGVLVIVHACSGTRPDPLAGPIRVFPFNDGPRVRVVGKSYGRGSDGKWRYYTEGSYCPLRYEPTVAEVTQARADYCLWWNGLVGVCRDLAGELTKWQPILPKVPAAPWIDGIGMQKKRVLYSIKIY